MHALTRPGALFLPLWVALSVAGCRQRVTSAQCDQLVARYAELVVHDSLPDASAAAVLAAQKQAREEAVHDDAFRNCTAEVQPDEFRCAMAATSPDAVEKCLE